ncbi:20687_t:CDS:2 [Dentiscutata erythropus]|uniref:20687_t:CDS:1 n=1 Tax=Dentiscutata erythropus TaxID=1348616 RepID=A0A9N9IY52_9GLOM|nr:20687_t:CDS:2 [Dentiscutata erythropus]
MAVEESSSSKVPRTVFEAHVPDHYYDLPTQDSNKPDFWVYIKIAGTIQENLYEEIPGKQKLGFQLIEENKEFL